MTERERAWPLIVNHNDRMEPTLKINDFVTIDPRQKRFDRPGIYCFAVPRNTIPAPSRTEFIFARVQNVKDGIMIQYDNNKYPAEFVPDNRINGLSVVGYAIMIQRDI